MQGLRRALVVALMALAPAHTALAQTRIAVLPIEGPTGEKAWHEAQKAAKKVGELVPQEEWDASAAKLFATSRSASDLSAVATDLKVQIIVTGKVKNETGWELSMSVRQGATGKSSAKLKYPLKGPRIDAATLKRLAEELPPAIEQAAAAPPEPGPDTGDTGASTAPADDTENPVGDAVRDKAGEQPAAMPDWANWFEASFGGVVGSRSFGFDEAGTPTFRSSGIGGIQLDATVWPLAFLAAGGSAALSGLGLGLSYGTNFWPGATPCSPGGPGGACLPTVDVYQSLEYRYEVGLRWRWSVKRKFDSPEVRVNAQYGEHAFAIQKRDYLNDHLRDIGPPDVTYSYVTIGVGALFPVFSQEGDLMRRVALYADFNLHLPFDSGSIQTADEWGPGSTVGLRFDAGLDLRLWRGLFVRLGAQVEYFTISFNQPTNKHNLMPPCPCGTTGGASDLYYSGVLAVGYTY